MIPVRSAGLRGLATGGAALGLALLAGCGAGGATAPTPSTTAVPGQSGATTSAPPSSTGGSPSAPPSSTAGSPSSPEGGGHGTSTPPAPAPARPYVASVPLPRGCLVVGPGIAGVKVDLVQRALGLAGHRETFDAATEAAVTAFQRAHRLRPTGRVDSTTWTALRTGYPFCIDRFTRQPTVRASAPASAHAAAALAFAQGQTGRRYIWGGAGPTGYDCSGLALQALYAGGRVVPGVTTDEHVRTTFNTAAAIYRSAAFRHVPLAQRRAGDLIFWGSDLHHMALYLGADRIVEAVRPVVRVAGLWSHGAPLPTVARPFP